MPNPIPDWNGIRYRGDLQDVKEMFEVFRVDHYLAAAQENMRNQAASQRQALMSKGIVLTEGISPRIYRLFRDACHALSLESEVEVICIRSQDVNAFAVVEPHPEVNYSFIGVTSSALEMLDDLELRSLLGHELSHFLFDNHKLNTLIRRTKEPGPVTVLPPLGESLFLRWRKKTEISADRAALIAAGSLDPVVRCLVKASFGLSEKNLNLDVPSLLQQIEKMRGSRETIKAEFESHPLLPVRLAALELFSRSEKAKRYGYSTAGVLLDDEQLEKGVDELMALTRRHPTSQRQKAMMNLVAAGGAAILGTDKEIGDTEVKTLIELLHEHFTDEPEEAIDKVCCDLKKVIDEWLPVLEEHGVDDDKKFVLSRITDIALADGILADAEATFLLELAERMKLPQRAAYSIMVGSAQSSGFRKDAKVAQIAERLRRQLSFGLPRNGEG
jgi:Zn-dependent protease with chaperone function